MSRFCHFKRSPNIRKQLNFDTTNSRAFEVRKLIASTAWPKAPRSPKNTWSGL